jgi:hypothetical protein
LSIPSPQPITTDIVEFLIGREGETVNIVSKMFGMIQPFHENLAILIQRGTINEP